LKHTDSQSINHLLAYNTSSNETARTSRRDKQDSQAPGALMAALVKHTEFPKTVAEEYNVQNESNKVDYNKMTKLHKGRNLKTFNNAN